MPDNYAHCSAVKNYLVSDLSLPPFDAMIKTFRSALGCRPAGQAVPHGSCRQTVPHSSCSCRLAGQAVPHGSCSCRLAGQTVPHGSCRQTVPHGSCSCRPAGQTVPHGSCSCRPAGQTVPHGSCSCRPAGQTVPHGSCICRLAGQAVPHGSCSCRLAGQTVPHGSCSCRLAGQAVPHGSCSCRPAGQTVPHGSCSCRPAGQTVPHGSCICRLAGQAVPHGSYLRLLTRKTPTSPKNNSERAQGTVAVVPAPHSVLRNCRAVHRAKLNTLFQYIPLPVVSCNACCVACFLPWLRRPNVAHLTVYLPVLVSECPAPRPGVRVCVCWTLQLTRVRPVPNISGLRAGRAPTVPELPLERRDGGVRSQ